MCCFGDELDDVLFETLRRYQGKCSCPRNICRVQDTFMAEKTVEKLLFVDHSI